MLQIILLTEHSLITSEFDNTTLDYLENTFNWSKQWSSKISIIVSQSHYQQVLDRINLLDQLYSFNPEVQYFIQPEFRGTAAAIIGASTFFEESDNLLILPILPNFPKDFDKYLEACLPWVNNGDMIVFGSSINPLLKSKGTLKTGKLLEPGEIAEYALDSVHLETESDLLSWQNTGIYLFQKLILSSEVYKHCPEIGNLCQQAIIFGEKDKSVFQFGPKYLTIPPKSWEESILKYTQTGTIVTVTNWVDF